MQPNDPQILVTSAADPAWIGTARKQNIGLDIIPLIETEAIDTIEVQQEVEQAATLIATVVFTSGNAVEAVTGMLGEEQPQWRIYCVGQKTRDKAAEHFGEENIAGTATNATTLAEQIIEDGEVDEVIFFCGNQRRDELPMLLEEESIAVQEIEVYETRSLARKLDKEYDAIVFFSPSAVQSFFSSNKIAAGVKIFVIGDTTRKSVQQYCNNRVSVTGSADRNKTIEAAIAYFL